MLREAFTERLKAAMRAKDTRTLSTVRLVIAGLKDRDIAARGAGNPGGIADAEILRMLQGMVEQRRESIALYRQGNRPELAQQEEEEILIIESFLPRQMSDDEIAAAAKAAIADTGAAGPKDMGRVMTALRIPRAVVIGIDAGGGVAQRLAVTRSTRRTPRSSSRSRGSRSIGD